jgi:hypothetical protein
MVKSAAITRVSNHEAAETIAGSGRQSIVPGRLESKDFGKLTLFGRQRLLVQRQAEALPDLQQRFGEVVDQAIVVIGRGRDP